MQYQITCFSPAGHAEKLAAAFRSILPAETACGGPDTRAPIHLVGFELPDADLQRMPEDVRSFLAELEGKTLFLFATVPMQPNDMIEKSVSDLVLASLPRECDYLGLYVCPAQPSASLLTDLEAKMAHDGDNWRAKYWHHRCVQAMGHPDAGDLQAGCRFASHVLALDQDPQ